MTTESLGTGMSGRLAPHHALHALAHALDVRPAHLGKERQRNRLARDALRDREHALAESLVAEERGEVDRFVGDAGADAFLVHRVHERLAAAAQRLQRPQHQSSRCASCSRPSRADTSEKLHLTPARSTSRVPSGRRLMPWKRSSSTIAASRSSLSARAPPSMVVMFLLGWKLNETMSPAAPTGPREVRDPTASAASSRMRTLWRLANASSTSGSSGAL